LAKTAKTKEYSIVEAKALVLDQLRNGQSLKVAMSNVGRNESTFRQWTFKDDEFKAAATRAREDGKDSHVELASLQDISFEQFSEEYLGMKLWPHHLDWVDALEGKTPRWLHPAMTYEPSRTDRLLFNVPPHHGKSTVITVNYVVWKIVTKPNTRVVIFSKSQGQARKFLRQIKDRLTNSTHTKMHVTFGPPGGYQADSLIWSADQILFKTGRDSGEKDPTVQSLGIGSQIQGNRTDLLILDDVVIDTNAHNWQDQIDWIQGQLTSRMGRHGKILIVGTRAEPIDLYKEIRSDKHWTGGKSPFTYLAMPAVLEFAEKKEDWVTLWPEADVADSDEDEPLPNGNYPMWDGPALFTVRSQLSPSMWAMVYQQEDISVDAIFQPLAVMGCVQGMRTRGVLNPLAPGHPKDVTNLYTIISMDPAMAGASGFVALAYNRSDGKIYVMDGVNMTDSTPQKIRNMIEEWVIKYKPQEFRVEINAHQKAYALDTDLVQWLSMHGCTLKPHFTGKNKWDTNLGVASMATLFGTVHDGRFQDNNTICLPSNERSEGIKTLVQQLITWKPDTKNPTDMVMALWFGIIRARELMQQSLGNANWRKNRWATRSQIAQRHTFNLDELAAEQWSAQYGNG